MDWPTIRFQRTTWEGVCSYANKAELMLYEVTTSAGAAAEQRAAYQDGNHSVLAWLSWSLRLNAYAPAAPFCMPVLLTRGKPFIHMLLRPMPVLSCIARGDRTLLHTGYHNSNSSPAM